MDLIDELRQFAKHIETIKDALLTEEATKTSLILPFFQKLGYDVFNPLEFVPEFTADVGVRKYEKVDYAIFIDGKPTILIEAKWCGLPLENRESQLFHYFAATEAKFGILTNGIIYKFYTDWEKPNKMDLTPFLEINLLDFDESDVQKLKRFSKEFFDIGDTFTIASELKYISLIKDVLERQRTNPDNAFVKYILSEIYPGKRTQQTLERFTPIVAKAYEEFITDAITNVINETLINTKQGQSKTPAPPEPVDLPEELIEKEPISKIVTTPEELEAFGIIKAMLRSVVEADKISHKDTESYFGILYDNNTRKWICRLKLDSSKKTLWLPPDTKYVIEGVNDLFTYADKIIESAQRFSKE